MTNEERQALIGLCRIEIRRWKAVSELNPNMSYMVELMEIALAALTTPPAPAIPDGWKLVPVEPTEAMLVMLGFTGTFESMERRYKDMIAVAPEYVEANRELA